MKKALIAALALMVVMGLFAGCGQQAAPPSNTPAPAKEPAKRGLIGFSVLTTDNPFFNEISASLTEAAKKAGYDVVTVNGAFDVAKQQNQVKDFIVQKAAAIVLCPCDSKAIGPVIQEANAAGIPVFTADIACTAPGADVVSHIATDNLQGGRMAADAIVEALQGHGKVAILDNPDIESVQLRTKGFHERLAELKQDPNVTIEVVATLPGGGAKEKSFQSTQDLIQAHPDLNGIFAINDPSALGARAALENAGIADKIVIVGFDGQPEGKQAIKEGKIFADPIQFPKEIGAKTADAIVKYMNGEKVDKEIRIPTGLYKKADAEAELK